MAVKTSFYTPEELAEIGFAKVGKNVLISRKASIYSPELIEIEDNVRIDDFCILSGKIRLGNYIHIAAGCYLFAGSYGIEMEDFSGLSSRVVVYAVTDDYSGKYLTNPTVPSEYRNVVGGKVHLGRYVNVGTGTTILPGVIIGEGSVIGAMSLVERSVELWGIYMGIPVRRIKHRDKTLLELEKSLQGIKSTQTPLETTVMNKSNSLTQKIEYKDGPEIEKKLIEIAQAILGKQIGLDDKREEVSGWDSFTHLLLVTRVEEEVGLVIPTEEVASIHCLRDFLKFVR